jgi:hypothetical protein
MKYKKWLPVLFLLIANLIPLVGVLLADWNAVVIILLYWSENIVIGIYNILKMTIVKNKKPSSIPGSIFTILFFCLHYGAFCGVHGFFIMNFLEIGNATDPTEVDPWPAHLVFIQMLFAVIQRLWANMPDGMIWPLLALFVSHGVSFVYNYLLAGEYKITTTAKLMHQPYKRIVVMHITTIAAGILVMKFNSTLPMLFILVLLKISMDIHLHNKEHGLYLFKKVSH